MLNGIYLNDTCDECGKPNVTVYGGGPDEITGDVMGWCLECHIECFHCIPAQTLLGKLHAYRAEQQKKLDCPDCDGWKPCPEGTCQCCDYVHFMDDENYIHHLTRSQLHRIFGPCKEQGPDDDSERWEIWDDDTLHIAAEMSTDGMTVRLKVNEEEMKRAATTCECCGSLKHSGRCDL